jgi:hypothetical protein
MSKIDLYVVVVVGLEMPYKFYHSYREAEIEAMKFVKKEKLCAYVFKAISFLEIDSVKITKLDK